jgi:hypothetical protein
MATDSQQTPRILTRGETTQFRVGFFADEAKTEALVPIDPSYPAYTIYNLEGTPIQTGTGTLRSAGNYAADFLVPKDAPLSYFQQAPQRYGNEGQGQPLSANDSRYRIEWVMLTAENFQVSFVEEFDVRDTAITQSQSRELKYMTMAGDAVRVMYRSSVIPYRVDFKMIVRGNEDNPVVVDFYDSTQPPGPLQGGLKIGRDGDSYVIYKDVAQGVTQKNTAYLPLWKIQETEFSIPVTQFQILIAVSTNILPLITYLRMLIDKFQKRLGRLQAYEDSDLLEYISQGLRMVNLSYPTTTYIMDQCPDDFQPLVLLAAGWYALQAQSILETELDFSFSGQSVTLSVSRASGLDSAASRMMDEFNKQIGPAKMAYVRKARGVGTYAGRSYSYRNMYNYTYKISSVGSNALLMNTLTKIGLL